jgi:hypothetical protein
MNTFDYSKTLEAYETYKSNGGKVDFLVGVTVDYVFDVLLTKKGKLKRVMHGIEKIAAKHEELLLASFIGKLRYKLPHLALGVDLDLFTTQEARLLGAATVTNCLLDAGVYELDERVETIEVNGEKKFKKELWIKLGGSYEADLYQGVHLEPGVVMTNHVNGWSLSEDEREFAQHISSVPFKIWDGCTVELLERRLELTPDWNKKVDSKGRKLREDRINRQRRKRKYADKIYNHMKRFPKFYLSGFYDGRKRSYYDASRLEGARPQGSLGEVLMIDSAKGFLLNEEDAEVLRHIIYVTLHGRKNLEQANAKFTACMQRIALHSDPMTATTLEEFDKLLLLRKAGEAYRDYLAGELNYSLFGLDFTNSGLMMAGVSFRSSEMMRAANLGALKTVHDSHTEFGKAFGLPLERDVVKKMHTALLHGGTERALKAEIEKATDLDISERQIRESNEVAYGVCVRNITKIADWGTMVVGNNQNILRWTMPDGWRASSEASMDNVPVRLTVPSARHKELYSTYVVTANMPLKQDGNGIPIYSADTVLDGKKYKVKVKKRGLYANITHSIDAFVLRTVVRALVDAEEPFLLKHDDFIVRPGARSIVIAAAQEAFRVLYERNVYQEALEEIAAHSPYLPMVPHLDSGVARNTASASENFLMP